MMSFFKSTAELQQAFGDIASSRFVDPRPLNDVAVGFSVQRNYPEEIRFKPARGQKSNNPDSIAVIWIVYEVPREATKRKAAQVPLRIRVGMMSKYRALHWDYNFDDEEGDCPTKASLEQSLASPQPVEVNFEGEYFYDHSRGCFIDRRGNVVIGPDILQRAFQDHCSTVQLLKSLRIRWSLAIHSGVIGFIGSLITIAKDLLKKVFGRTVDENASMAGLYSPYPRSQFKRLNEDSIDLLGYKASKNVVILFCALVVIASVTRYLCDVEKDYFTAISDGEFLSLAHAIVGLWILDVAVPNILFVILNVLVLVRKSAIFSKIRA